MPAWLKNPPHNFDIATGFFPEAQPKPNWSENPRPLLVTGVFRNKRNGEVCVRVAYGTTQVEKVRGHNLNIGNMSHLDNLNLARPTAFVLMPGRKQAILPWSEEHFACWSGFKTPVISRLSDDMQRYVKEIMKGLKDLPTPVA